MYPYGTIVDSWTFAGRNFRIHLLEGETGKRNFWIMADGDIVAINGEKPSRLWCHAVYYELV